LLCKRKALRYRNMKSIKQMLSTISYIIRLQWSYDKLSAIGQFVALITNQICVFFNVYAAAKIISIVSSAVDGTKNQLIIWVCILLICEFYKYTETKIIKHYERMAFYNTDEKIRERRILKISKIKMEYFETCELYRSNSSISRFTAKEINSVYVSCVQVISNLITLIMTGVILISISPLLFSLFIVAYLPFCFISIKNGALKAGFAKTKFDTQKKLDSLFSFAADRKAVQEIKIFGACDYLIKRRQKIFISLRNDTLKFNLKLLNKCSAFKILPLLLYYSVYFVLGLYVLSGRLMIADFWLAVGCIQAFSASLTGLIGILSSISYLNALAVDYKTFFEYEEERTTENKMPKYPTICLNNLSFKYPGSDKHVLKNISFSIHNDNKIAIVGYNGAGKTTLSKLIIGLYNDYDGDLYFGKENSKNLSNKSIYNLFSVAMQDYCKYPFSLKENVVMSEDVDEKKYTDSLKLSKCDTIANSLCFGDQTILNKQFDVNGTDLSEGQWHTVILARSFYNAKSFVLFDEPTASLDPVLENNFISNMLKHSEEKTVIVISHRLSCIKNFDKILVLDNGQLVEEGTHEQLISIENGVYKKMWYAQSSKYNK